ncbi:DUF3560 domain-containing protein [Saccharopolyspora sp. K220]|uniref:DUF3560 domain-containing protein n=1 Tax=Saccharopolyspora soli TaxID=2926618 RepID=UPI001F5780A2|nr:DUF3560 domain-containing protein [Saccharopolyspora soli]MCI2423057.1 DUF3560 domain-containing protein [Saccharopolyspora soli]
MSAITIEISHTMAEGTLMRIFGGTIPADVLKPIARAQNWRWSRYLGAYHQQQSRDQLPRRWRIDATATALRAAGYTVTVSIDTTLRPMEESEADRAERIEDYADRRHRRADRKSAEAAATRKKATDVFDHIPFGQPMMPGHHSYNRDRRQRERAWNNLGKSYKQQDYANKLHAQAETARNHTDHRYAPRAVRSRVRNLEKELRTAEVHLTQGTYLAPGVREPLSEGSRALWQETKERLEHQLAYWRPIMDQYIAEGKLSNVTREDVKGKNKQVKARGRWYDVVRANPTTVTVKTMRSAINPDDWLTGKYSYDDVTEVRDNPHGSTS